MQKKTCLYEVDLSLASNYGSYGRLVDKGIWVASQDQEMVLKSRIAPKFFIGHQSKKKKVEYKLEINRREDKI